MTMKKILSSPHGGFEDPLATGTSWCGPWVADGMEGEDVGPHPRWPELRSIKIEGVVGAPTLWIPAEV